MTDDFHLFGDPDDGERPIDPDLALISAYLARELSPMQVLALEERLATDAEFRAAMQPLLDAWAAPVPSLTGGVSLREAPLSELEREGSWQRFRREASPASDVRQVSPRRRTSMKRAAAVAALVVVPMASFAQVVVYAANHPDARGHAIAKRIVAPFVGETSGLESGAQLPDGTLTPNTPSAREVDTSALLPVPTTPVFGMESESTLLRVSQQAANAVRAMQGMPEPQFATSAQAQVRQPDRARVAALAREHQPAVVNGVTSAEHIVMVIDAAEQYVWSTSGRGNVMIEVAGDARPIAERNAYIRDHSLEFWGDSLPPSGFSGVAMGMARGVAGGVARASAGGGGSGSGMVRTRVDSTFTATDTAGRRYIVSARAGTSPERAVRVDSLGEIRLRVQGAATGAGGHGTGGGSVTRVDSVRRGTRVSGGTPVIRGAAVGAGTAVAGERRIVESFGTITTSSGSHTYQHGFMTSRSGPDVNRADGLVPLENGWSGIEGLPSTSVAGAETYLFPAGDLAPTPLRVLVVRLVPGAVWAPR